MYANIQILNLNIKLLNIIQDLLQMEQNIDKIIILKMDFIERKEYIMEKKDMII